MSRKSTFSTKPCPPATPIAVDPSKNSETHYVQIDGNAIYDAAISNPKQTSAACPVVKPLNLYRHKEQVCAWLGADFIPDWTSRTAEDDGSSFIIKTDEGARISVSERGMLECKTKLGYDAEILPVNDFGKIYAYPETDFLWNTRAACAENAAAILQKLDIDLVCSKTVAITAEKYEKRYQENLPFWEEEKKADVYAFLRDHIDYEDDELFYVVNLQQCIDGIPIYNHSLTSGFAASSANSMDIYTLCSCRGLEAINCQSLYEQQTPGETQMVISFEAAVQTFSHYVNNELQMTEPMRIVYVGLEYVPDRSPYESGDLAVLRPCWIFRVDIPEANRRDTAILDYCVDAVTGEVL